MYSRPMIFPLDSEGVLYALEDEYGNQIGVGSRDVCRTLLHLITNSPLMRKSGQAAEAAFRRVAPARDGREAEEAGAKF